MPTPEERLPDEPEIPSKDTGGSLDTSTIIIWILALAMVGVALSQSRETAMAGLRGSLEAARDLTPLLLAVFIIVGYADQILPRELIAEWLGSESGFRGILIACGLGAITPGGPFVSYPLVATLYRSGAGVGPVIAFVTSWSLWAVSRLPLEFALVGTRLTLIRLGASLVFPPLAGVLAQAIVRWLRV